MFKMGVAYIMGGRGRFWEGRLNMLKREVYSGREGGVDSGRVAYICLIGVYSGRVTCICLKGEGYILGCRGRFCEGRLYM